MDIFQEKGRDEMKGYNVYSKIHQMREAGFSQRAIAKTLGISRKTVKRYWDMGVDEYERTAQKIVRIRSMGNHRDQIISWLREYPTLTAAQVCDWLKEHYGENYAERTVSRYVKELREEYHLPRRPNPRSYEAVAELPMGQQMQVDFGQSTLKNVDGGWTKVYVAAFLLSHSRYKYAQCQSRPFTAPDLVAACHNCFRYWGGMPREMVFDQDSIVCVSENNGDIIYTYEFEKFRQDCKMEIYLCRGADPESKGKIENTVKFVKGNFLNNRLYVDDEILNRSCLDWLERTGNAKVHGTTRKVPADVFREERETLRPLATVDRNATPYIRRTVRKDNTILYDSNRYSVPLGTYNTDSEVQLEISDGNLRILTVFGDLLCEHRISTGRGLIIQNKSHLRDRATALDQLQNSLDEQLKYRAAEFLQRIREEKSRYARDQFRLLQTLLDRFDTEQMLDAISFCMDSNLCSANTVKDYLEHRTKEKKKELPSIDPDKIPVKDPKYHITTQKRSLAVYAKVGGQ